MEIDHVYKHGDFYAVFPDQNGAGYCVYPGDPRYSEIEAEIAEHPEALVPEPAPPEPTAAEVEAARVASIRAKLDDLDRKAIRPLRAIAAGSATQADRDALATLEARAAEIREALA